MCEGLDDEVEIASLLRDPLVRVVMPPSMT